MNRAKFFEAASQLSNWIVHLSGTAESALRQAEDMLCRAQEPLPGAPPPRALVLMSLDDIGEKIEEVMYAYDTLCDAADGDERFEIAFLFRDASPAVRSEVRLRLYGFPATPDLSDPEGDAS